MKNPNHLIFSLKRMLKYLFSIQMFIFLLLIISTGCDEINSEIIENDKDDAKSLFISFDLNLSNNLKDYTSKSTTEIIQGLENENRIDNARILFYDQDSKKLLFSLICDEKNILKKEDNDGAVFTVASEVDLHVLSLLLGKKINLYVICNYPYSKELIVNDENNFLETKVNTQNGGLNLFQSCLSDSKMTSCFMVSDGTYELNLSEIILNEKNKESELEKLKKELFKDFYSNGKLKGKSWNLTAGNTDYNIGSLGTIKLERNVARIDYKDASEGNNNIYSFPGITFLDENGSEQEIYLKVCSLEMFNISKESFLFRHIVEKDIEEKPQGNIILFGKEGFTEENNYNWVVDSDWAFKSPVSSGNNSESNTTNSSHFINGIYIIDGIPEPAHNSYSGNTNILSLEKIEDTRLEWESIIKENDGYFPWLYIPENTLPDNNSMTLQLSTGILFKVALSDKKGDIITKNNEDIRLFTEQGEYLDIKWTTNHDYLKDGYYLTYYYLIEHNKKSFDSILTENAIIPMHIGIVRNNIYRIAIKGFTQFPNYIDLQESGINIRLTIGEWEYEKREVDW